VLPPLLALSRASLSLPTAVDNAQFVSADQISSKSGRKKHVYLPPTNGHSSDASESLPVYDNSTKQYVWGVDSILTGGYTDEDGKDWMFAGASVASSEK